MRTERAGPPPTRRGTWSFARTSSRSRACSRAGRRRVTKAASSRRSWTNRPTISTAGWQPNWSLACPPPAVTDLGAQPTELCGAAAASPPGKPLFGQPRGLATLFFTEMWERFTYYGMRAILILFMVSAVSQGGLGIDDKTASSIYGLFVAGSYLFSLFGGWIADRLIGGQLAVIGGGVFIMRGNVLLAFGTTQVFFMGLASIALGVGLLK